MAWRGTSRSVVYFPQGRPHCHLDISSADCMACLSAGLSWLLCQFSLHKQVRCWHSMDSTRLVAKSSLHPPLAISLSACSNQQRRETTMRNQMPYHAVDQKGFEAEPQIDEWQYPDRLQAFLRCIPTQYTVLYRRVGSVAIVGRRGGGHRSRLRYHGLFDDRKVLDRFSGKVDRSDNVRDPAES